MKKVYILMVLLICFIFGQITYCAEPATLDGFLGLPWGASSQQIKNLMKTRPKTTLKSEDQKVIIYESTFAGEDAEIGFFIYQDKMWQAVILINFEEYEVIKKWKTFCEDISQKYGFSGEKYYFFESPYYERDGYEEQAIRRGKGTAFAFWEFQKQDGSASDYISCEITTSLSLLLRYQNGQLASIAVNAYKKEKSADL